MSYIVIFVYHCSIIFYSYNGQSGLIHENFINSLCNDFNVSFFFNFSSENLEKSIASRISSINHSCTRNLDNALDLYVYNVYNTSKSEFCVLTLFNLNINLSGLCSYLSLNLFISLWCIYLLLFELNIMAVYKTVFICLLWHCSFKNKFKINCSMVKQVNLLFKWIHVYR